MNILITGGAGFIGSHFVDLLVKKKNIKKITIIDNLEDGTLKNLKDALNSKKVKFVKADIRDFNKIKGQKAQLRELGYDCAMIFVNTDLETAQERNIKRGEEGGRTLPPEMAKQFWHDVQGNIGKFQNLFGRNMYIVDNSKESNVQGAMQSVYKRMAEWAATPHRNPTALAWVFANQK